MAVVLTPAATPTFSPSSGSYGSTQSVTISTSTSGCGSYIYWNTTGSPTSGDTNGTSVSVTASETVYAKVIGCPTNSDSSVGSAAYTITSPTAPSGFTATDDFSVQGGSFTFTLTSLNVTSGQAVVIGFGLKDGSTNYCATVSSVTATGGDTFTNVGNANQSGQACTSVWINWNPTPNATYVITLHGNGSSPGFFVYNSLRFTKGSIVGTADGTCSGATAGAFTIDCSTAIVPTGSVELVISTAFANDAMSGSQADHSTPAFTVPSGLGSGGSGGSVLISYYIGNPPAGSITPGWTGLGSGDALVVWGGAFK